MLDRDPAKRATVEEVLGHEWVREGGVADDKHIDIEVMGRIKKFAAMNRLKKEALVVRGGKGWGLGRVRGRGQWGGGRECARVEAGVLGGGGAVGRSTRGEGREQWVGRERKR